MADEAKKEERSGAWHYDAPMAEFPLHERMIYTFVMAVLWVFSKLMWRWRVEDARSSTDLMDRVPSSFATIPPWPKCCPSSRMNGRRIAGPSHFKSEFNKAGIVRWAFALAGGIPVGPREAI